MPEGDTIAQWADDVRRVLLGERLLEVALAPVRRRATLRPVDLGATVSRVEAVGKHLLIGTERRWLRGHAGLKGSWRVGPPDAPVRRDAGILLRTATATVQGLRPREVEVVPYVEELRRIPRLAALGPDLLGEVDLPHVVARARVVRDRERTLAAVLTDQAVACGLGNVYKSEVCFLLGLLPLTPLDALTDDRLHDAFALGSELLRANRHERRRRTRPAPGPRLWVYERAGQPCFRCGRAIAVTRHTQQGRAVWWCKTCQRAP